MDSAELAHAQLLIKNGENIKKVSIKLNIDYQLLYNHIKGINKTFKKGRPCLLPYDVEVELTNIASYLAERNLGLNYRRFVNIAKELYDHMHPNTPENKKPKFSLKWWKKFKHRHSDFGGMRPKTIDASKKYKCIHTQRLSKYFLIITVN